MKSHDLPKRAWKILPAAVVCVLLGLSSIAGEGEKKSFRTKFRADLILDYTDNLFRLSDAELRVFDELQGPGERFSEMESAEDVIVRLRLGADFSWRLAPKRKLRLTLRGDYYGHASNTEADYPRFRVGMSGDLSRRDALYGGVEVIVDRFWKNLRVADTRIFAPAVYDQTDLRFGYQRQLGKRWTAGFEYRHRIRRYDPPLQSRDRDGDYLAASTDYRIVKGIAGKSWLEAGEVQTETVEVDLVLIDRSYRQLLFRQGFVFKLSGRTALELSLELRERDFTTGEEGDEARFDRVDQRVRVEMSLGIELLEGLILDLRARHTDNDSDRADPTADSDQLGYTESRLGVGVRYRF